MIFTLKYSLLAVVAAAIAGCASAPERLEAVSVHADTPSPKYSAIKARVEHDRSEAESTFTASLDPEVETLTRLESSYTQTLGSDSQSLRVGDTVSSAGMWGNSVRYGGVQFGTSVNSSRDALGSTSLASNGIAVVPTAADALFASMDHGTGLVAQQNLAIAPVKMAGANSLSFTAKDTLGRSESITVPMIESAQLVQSGCSNFAMGLGKVRRDYAVTSNGYGPLFANTTVSCAAPLGFTVEGHGEYMADEVAALGLGLSRTVGPLGTASVAFASSQAEVGAGWLARVGFDHRNSLFNLMVRSRLQSREFRDVGTAWSTDPIMQRNLASVGLNVTRSSSLALAYASQTTWSQERSNLIALSQTMAMGRGSVSMSAGHSLVESIGSSVFLTYKRPFGIYTRRSVIEEFDLDLFNIPVPN